ncbi:hypothetical protein, partial [Paracoccus yeei]|uniref:hypothetical protein n=1 Tax=Paracoccus yeei TaxID=147645 RepID=UPI001C8E9313
LNTASPNGGSVGRGGRGGAEAPAGLGKFGTGWLGRRHEGNGAVWVVLFPLLFDIARYLKGYAGGLVVFRLMSLHIGLVGVSR